MESPVRICLGVALVVHLLLLCGTSVDGGTIPLETTTPKNERTPRARADNAWPARNPKTPDVSINELSPKDSTSEEHTEKNAKYKDRGRVRFGSNLKSTTTSSLRRVRTTTTTSTEAPTLVIVTPTPPVKTPQEIINNMQRYKKTNMPTSTTPMSVNKEEQSVEEYESKEEEEDGNSFEKYTSSKFHDNDFFTIPNFDEADDFNHDSENESSNNKVKQDFSSPSYSFSSYFPKASYGYKEDSDPFKSSFFDFDTELTTPKNDFFDERFKQISSSIKKNLDSVKAKSPPPNMTNVHKIVKENIGLERQTNNTPSNKSSVFLKNTKEIRLSDNQGAGSVNKELSDVQGTSIYYEMSVLSTETYAINHSNEDDCDNDTTGVEATASTSPQEELADVRATKPTYNLVLSKPIETLSTVSSNFLPISSIHPNVNSINSDPTSTQNYASNTDRTIRIFSNSYTRNRNYSKRLNFTGTKDSPNSVTLKTDTLTNTVRPQTRKFHYTTPKIKSIWMSPRRNITRYTRPTNPTTIYSEHFDIKNKYATGNVRQPSKAMLTTVPSAEIDPVFQSDIGGIRKVVHSQLISDNTIPSLRKRGSSRFTTSTASSSEKETDLSEMEIPSTAWALAGLISPPSQSSNVVNATENELQKVGEVLDKKEKTVSLTTTPKAIPISNDIITKKVTDVVQNKLPWQPASSLSALSLDKETSTEVKSERLAAESNISFNNAELITTESVKDNSIDAKSTSKVVKPLWIPAMDMETSTAKSVKGNETIPPVDATKSTGFESITKLPAEITTPQDETVASSEVNQTVTDVKSKTNEVFEITTIRFGYLPTEANEETTEYETTTTGEVTTASLSVVPTRTKLTTIQDGPITTYRPMYMTSTDTQEPTTIVPDTTSVIEVSSQVIANATEKLTETTETVIQTTTEAMTMQPTVAVTTEASTTPTTTTTTSTTPESIAVSEHTTETLEDTTTIVIEVVTEINTEKVTILYPNTTSTEKATTETDCTSEENSGSNEIIHETKTTSEVTTESETPTPTTDTTVLTETTSQSVPPHVPETTSRVSVTTPQTAETTSHIFETSSHIVETTSRIAESTTRLTETMLPVETTEPTRIIESTTDVTTDTESTKPDDLTNYAGEVTTEASSRVLPDEAGSGAAVAIAVSTIGVIALILLIGLLLVVRRRGRRGIYAQRCTPVSLDAYSLDSVSVGHRKGNQRLRSSKRSYGNPAYDDEVTSHPMQYPALANFALDVDSMTAEFSEIPTLTVRPEEVPPGCEDKNRYSNVLPLPETRVQLRRLGNDPTSEYINANFVTGPGNIRNYYILAQAPLSNTVNDFWRMIWEQNSRLIVMLTEYMENGVEKCYEYLPPSEVSDNKRTFGSFQIVLKKREQRDKYAISTIQMINLSTRSWREVTHLWYFWPAKGVPEDYDSLIDFLFEMRSYMKVSQTAKEYDEEGIEVIYGDQNRSSFNNLSKLRDDNNSANGVNVYSPAKAEEQLRRGYANNGTLSRMKAASEVEGIRPCVVTCASGAGRSAAVCALDVCARSLHGGACDVPRVVRHMRTQRPHSLANRHHYMFLYKVLSEYGNKMMGGGDTI